MEWLPGDLFQSKQKNEENIIMTINRERLYVLDVNNIFYRGEKYKTNWSYSHDKFAFYLVSNMVADIVRIILSFYSKGKFCHTDGLPYWKGLAGTKH